MKTFFKTMMLAAVSAMAFSGCSETFDDIVTGDAAVDMVELTISTEKPEIIDTRTMVDTDGKTPLWCVGDAIGVSVFAGGAYTNYEFMSDCTEPSKVTTFTGKTPVGDKIYTYYPYSANGVDAQGTTVVEIPAVQHPTATSFDGSADLLVGLPASMPVETTNIEGLRFKRVGGFLKIVLKEQDGSTLAGQIVEKVSVTADKALAGEASLDIVKGVLGEAAADGSKTVTADYTSATRFAVDGDGAAYLGVYPQTLAKGTKLTVSAVTTHYQVEREIELPEDIEINAGRITTLNIKIMAENISEKTLEFPDPIFREYVLKNFDTDKDGKISVEEALKVRSIDVSKYRSTPDNERIASLEGVQYFTNLEYLWCDYNSLTSLDVSRNTALIWLSCHNNQLATLDVSNNLALENLSCSDNQLTDLDVSKNTALTVLECGWNQLTDVDVSKNTALTAFTCTGNQLATLDVSKNTALKILDCGTNSLTTLDLTNNTALTDLICYHNQLMSLDLSHNVVLRYLDCSENLLTSLDLSHNTALWSLICTENQLTDLDVLNNTALEYLSCYSNLLTTLDLSKNTVLTKLFCYNNQLTTLNVSECSVLAYLECYNNQLTTLDVSQNTALIELWCHDNQLTDLDVSQNTILKRLYCYDNQLTTLDVSKTNLNGGSLFCAPMETLNVLYLKAGWEINGITTNRSPRNIPKQTIILFIDDDGNIFDEDGNMVDDDAESMFPDPIFREYILNNFDKNGDSKISQEEALMVTEIDVFNEAYAIPDEKKIKSLEGVQHFSNLATLRCSGNSLTALDVSHNQALNILMCSYNQLTELDVSNNLALTWLECSYNPLIGLDVSHNTELNRLDCAYNQLTNLDVSKNTALITLDCDNNLLTKLDLSQNTILRWLACTYNQFANLDLSQNSALECLYCHNNQLTTLDVSKTKLDNSAYIWPLFCAPMDTLEKLYIKSGSEIPYITQNRNSRYIPEHTQIVFVDENGNVVDGNYGNEGEAGGELGDNENDVR